MPKYILIFLLLVLNTNISFCAGINNVENFKNTYIIDVASENLSDFIQKLELYLKEVKNEFIIFFSIAALLLFLTFITIKKFTKEKSIYILLILSFISFKFLKYKWKDYKSGIQSAKCAINNYYLAMEENKYTSLDENDRDGLNFEEIYIGDEIEKYGLHAVFCSIPGTLPSKNANPESYSYLIGGSCYNYFSQKRYVDKNDPSYAGDEISKKYKEVKPIEANIFWNK